MTARRKTRQQQLPFQPIKSTEDYARKLQRDLAAMTKDRDRWMSLAAMELARAERGLELIEKLKECLK